MAKNLTPFFSVIIPALNEEKYLPNLLKDLSVQSFRDFEVIVVDGKSEDKTVSKALSFKDSLPSLTVLSSNKRHVCTQRNLGADRARADWLIFMDADNRLPDYFLQGIKYRLESDPTDMATTWVNNEFSKKIEKTIALVINQALELMKNSEHFLFPESMTIISRRVFFDVGKFDENTHYAEGQKLTQKLMEKKYSSKLYKDPSYSFSLRRLRKFGLLGLASRMAQAQFAVFTGVQLTPDKIKKIYPMKGGQYFDKPYSKRKSFVKNISTLFDTINSPEKLKNTLEKIINS